MPTHQDRYEINLELVTIAGTVYATQADLSHYEDVAELEDDILGFLPTVSELDVAVSWSCSTSKISNLCQKHSALCSCTDRSSKLSSVRRHTYLVVPLVQGHCCPRFHDWPQLDLGSSTLQTPWDRIGYTPGRRHPAAHTI